MTISDTKLIKIDSSKQIQEDMKKYLPSIRPVLGGKIIKNYQEESEQQKYIYIKAENNIDVLATANGKVIKITDDPSSKHKIIIINHSKNYTTVYSNLVNLKVQIGQTVNRWDTLGTIDNSSKSFLKYEVIENGKNIDPSVFIIN
jgi:murein DD-endopeptidase MepM/ murein hydrolase activator NlpD